MRAALVIVELERDRDEMRVEIGDVVGDLVEIAAAVEFVWFVLAVLCQRFLGDRQLLNCAVELGGGRRGELGISDSDVVRTFLALAIESRQQRRRAGGTVAAVAEE